MIIKKYFLTLNRTKTNINPENFEINVSKSMSNNIINPKPLQKGLRRKHWNNWYIMINTNKVFTNIECNEFKILENKLVKAFNMIVGNYENQTIFKYIVFKELSEYLTANIYKFKTSDATKVGNNIHRLHFHVLLSFYHNTLIKLDYDKFKRKMKELVSIKLAMLYKIYLSANTNVENYINKYNDITKSKKQLVNFLSLSEFKLKKYKHFTFLYLNICFSFLYFVMEEIKKVEELIEYSIDEKDFQSNSKLYRGRYLNNYLIFENKTVVQLN
jgi:hypothetical protein